MIFPCIDLMDGKVVQLVQGRDKALEGDAPLEMLRKFAAFPEIQVIDLDAAMGKGENSALVELLAGRARCRVGGGVRTPERARRLIEQGAHRVIVGTAAFTPVMREIAAAVGPERILIALDSKHGKIVVKGWQEATDLTAEDVIHQLEPLCGGFLCTYVDKEGMLQGTDLDWFRRLRAATKHEITAAGGITTIDDVRALLKMNVHAALGMAIYTGRLDLAELAKLQEGERVHDRKTSTVHAGSTTYFITDVVPRPDELPWGSEECDAFVAILDPQLLTGQLATDLSLRIVGLTVDWVETMGEKAESLHDSIDNASVLIGRQKRVGDGIPMTAWHQDLSHVDQMRDYLVLGGHGGTENKLVVVIGPEGSAALLAERLRITG